MFRALASKTRNGLRLFLMKASGEEICPTNVMLFIFCGPSEEKLISSRVTIYIPKGDPLFLSLGPVCFLACLDI